MGLERQKAKVSNPEILTSGNKTTPRPPPRLGKQEEEEGAVRIQELEEGLAGWTQVSEGSGGPPDRC